MRSSPHLSRGTSVIAALVLAVFLGAVALGLNAVESSSANTAALPAQSAAATQSSSSSGSPTGTYNQTCQAGHVYFVAQNLSGQYDINPQDIKVTSGSSAVALTFNYPANYTYGKPVVIGDATANKCDHTSQVADLLTGRKACVQVSSGGTGDNYCKSQYSVEYGGQTKTISCPGATQGSQGNGVVIYTKNNTLEVEQCQPGQNIGSSSGATPSVPTVSGTNGAPTLSSNTGVSGIPAACQQDPTSLACNQAISSAPNGSFPSTPSSTNNPTTGTSCTENSDCGSGYLCQVGQCVPAQSGSNWCGNGAIDPPACITCPSGTTMQASYCQTSATASPGAPKTPTAATPNVATPRVSSPSSNPLTAFATGLLRGLTTQPCTTTGQPYVQSPYVGGTGYTLVPVQTVNALGQVQTTYVQQPTTAGVTPYGTPCTPTTAQTAPYGVGTNGAACTQPPAMPQCAAGSTAEPISSSGNGCTTGYQCVPSGSSSTFTQPPTPQISCSPQVADANESVAITYSCLNATGSTGGGFSTNNQTSGTATSTLNPPAGTNTANFEITCTDGAQSANAQCQVQINHPAIVLVGNPAAVQSGKTSSIGWVTAGMQSCVISSPDDANFTSANAGDQNVNGVAETDPITGDTEFDLTCQTLGGQTKTASAMITVAASSSDSGGGE